MHAGIIRNDESTVTGTECKMALPSVGIHCEAFAIGLKIVPDLLLKIVSQWYTTHAENQLSHFPPKSGLKLFRTLC